MRYRVVTIVLIVALLVLHSVPEFYSISSESISRDSCTVILEERSDTPFTQDVEKLNPNLTFVPVKDANGVEEGFIVKQSGTSEGDSVTGIGGDINVSMMIPAGKRCCVSIAMVYSWISSASVTLIIGDREYGPVPYSERVGDSGERYFGIQGGIPDGELIRSSKAEDVWFTTDSKIEVEITGQRGLSDVVVKILVDNNVTNS